MKRLGKPHVKPLAKLARAFVTERRALGNAPSYLNALRRTLETLRDVAKARVRREPDVVDLRREDLVEVVESYRRRGLSRTTLSDTGVILRVFCRWLTRKKALLLDPSRDFLVTKRTRHIGYVPSPGDVARLIAAAEREVFEAKERKRLAYALRNVAMLELLYGSGLRIGELFALELRDVDLSERTAFIKNAKFNKDRVVPITKRAADAITRYLDVARKDFVSMPFSIVGRPPGTPRTAPRRRFSGSKALFLSARGDRMKMGWTKETLSRLRDRARLPRELTPHRLRHACAVHLLESGADVVTISRLLGHGTLDVTALYLALTTSALAKTLLKAHPRERDTR